jgi:hypothetical protein
MSKINKVIHKIDNEIMMIAIEVAKKSDMRCKHGCVIIDNKGNIISTGYNKTIPTSSNILKLNLYKEEFEKKHKLSRHAEENALRNADPRKLDGAKLYVVRWGNLESNPLFMQSKPCKRCTLIIESCMKKFGLRVVYYSN